MMVQSPTRDQVIELIEKLIAGETDQITVAQWAEQFDYVENQQISETLEKSDPILREFIGSFSLAAAINEKGDFLYSTSDFVEWLDEFKHRR